MSERLKNIDLTETPEIASYREKLRKAFESIPENLSPKEIVEYKAAAETEFFRALIKMQYPDLEAWSGMDIVARATIKLGNKYLSDVARSFRVSGNPMGDDAAFMELGRLIYGVQDDSETE